MLEIISTMILYCEIYIKLNFESVFHHKMCTKTVGNHFYYDAVL